MNENDFNREMFGISYDFGADDYGCMVGYRIDEDGIINIEDIKYFPKKEVKKLSRQYLELKIVKVKKCRHFLAKWTPGNIYKCCKCGKIVTERGHKPIKPKGNWVNNGENLDKIKFPCFCSYI